VYLRLRLLCVSATALVVCICDCACCVYLRLRLLYVSATALVVCICDCACCVYLILRLLCVSDTNVLRLLCACDCTCSCACVKRIDTSLPMLHRLSPSRTNRTKNTSAASFIREPLPICLHPLTPTHSPTTPTHTDPIDHHAHSGSRHTKDMLAALRFQQEAMAQTRRGQRGLLLSKKSRLESSPSSIALPTDISFFFAFAF
jgi:hypothetical protein